MYKKKEYSWVLPTIIFGLFFLFVFSVHGQSLERPPEAPNQEPAFEQQTRVERIETQADYDINVIASGLNEPWGLDFLPDGRMILTERLGTMRIVSAEGDVSDPLDGVPSVRSRGSGGLLDIKIAPDFEDSRHVFFTYVEDVGGGDAVNCVARGRLSSDGSALEDVEVIYRTSPAYSDHFHLGSRLLFDSEGAMWVTLGDRFENSVRINAQELDSSVGKIIRINQDGSVPDGNPFISESNALGEVWSIGHRNAQGLAVNPVTGDLWSSEHGPRGGDEVNIIQPGANYGWPVISYGIEYNGRPVSGQGLTQREGMEQPVYYWDPAVAPSGMTFYTGDLIPEWKNNLFVAALRGLHIARLVVDNSTNRIVGEERLLVDEQQRFRIVVQGPDEALYALTDQGRVYRIGN